MVHIRHNLTINAPSETVYKAVTTKNGIHSWWTADTKTEPKVGSIAEFNFGDRYNTWKELIDSTPLQVPIG